MLGGEHEGGGGGDVDDGSEDDASGGSDYISYHLFVTSMCYMFFIHYNVIQCTNHTIPKVDRLVYLKYYF